MKLYISDYFNNKKEEEELADKAAALEFLNSCNPNKTKGLTEMNSRLVGIDISSADTYSLDGTLSIIISQCLIAYRNKVIERGIFKYVENAVQQPYDLQWVSELNAMIKAFEDCNGDIEGLYVDLPLEEYKAACKAKYDEIQKGINLFAEHFFDLWW